MEFSIKKAIFIIFLILSLSIFSEDKLREPALTINEPMYFILGLSNNDVKARLQFSFKYRLFDEDGIVVKKFSFAKNLYLGYTQTSLWNISASSSPFEDSSYRPSFFWEKLKTSKENRFEFFRIGYENESNGQGGSTSISFDTIFGMKFWNLPLSKNNLVIGAKIYFYIFKGRFNKDIQDYRGWADLIIRYGSEDGWCENLLLRFGENNKKTFQLDISYPVREKIFSRAGGYLYLQIFYGWGETLLFYNKKSDLNLYFGYAIVR